MKSVQSFNLDIKIIEELKNTAKQLNISNSHLVNQLVAEGLKQTDAITRADQLIRELDELVHMYKNKMSKHYVMKEPGEPGERLGTSSGQWIEESER